MKPRTKLGLLAACLLIAVLAPARASAISLQTVPGSFSSPIFVTSPPGDPRLFVVERGGTIQALHDGTQTQFLDISARTTTDGERGLLSMAFDPNYATNGLFYVFYTGDGNDAAGALGDIYVDEFRVGANPNVADPASRRTVWTFSHSASNHNGGQLQFGPDRYLYMVVGDNANGANAQTTANPYGKMMRIDPRGVGQGIHGIPPTNPYTASPTPEIWSLGLRNPFRFSFDHLTGDLTIGDVGASSREEIDFSPLAGGLGVGTNYGWPTCEGFQGTNCARAGWTPPVFDYGRSGACNAIIGGYVYRGNQIPDLAGRYLYTDLCHPDIRSIQLGLPLASDDRSEGVNAPASPVSFGEDSSCELYVMGGNTVDKIVGSGTAAAPACVTSAGSVPGSQPPAFQQPQIRRCQKKKHKKRATESKQKKHKEKRCGKKKKGKKRS